MNEPKNMSMVVNSQTDEMFKESDVKEVWFVGGHAGTFIALFAS